jgi:hypothetical protein
LAGDQIEVGHERPAGKAFDIPSLPARLPCQVFIVIIFIQIAEYQQFAH